nr:Chain B, Major curlin subunit [Escherichia coli]
TASNSS